MIIIAVCAQVQAIAQPIHSSDWALNRAREAAESLKADFVVIDQTELHTKLQVRVSTALDSCYAYRVSMCDARACMVRTGITTVNLICAFAETCGRRHGGGGTAFRYGPVAVIHACACGLLLRAAVVSEWHTVHRHGHRYGGCACLVRKPSP